MTILCIECRRSKGILDAPHELLDIGICPSCGSLHLLYEVNAEGFVPKEGKEPSAPTFGQAQTKRTRKSK